MRVISGPQLAVKVSEAGGIGFIGPGAEPEHLENALELASEQVQSSKALNTTDRGQLPLGIGFQTWAGNLTVAKETLSKRSVAVVWLFAPRHGQAELDEWVKGIKEVSPGTQIWIQVASVKDAVAAASSKDRPDALVIQGTDAGGHSLTKGAGIITLLPEVSDALEALGSDAEKIPLIAAGGIIDARGAAAALTLGASGVAIGTRLLASKEATINLGYQTHVVSASDGGQNTVRTQLYNHLRGTTNWPEGFDARGLINQSWRDHEAGLAFEKNKELHVEAMKKGSEAWGEQGRAATYAGTGVGLIKEVKSAGEIVQEIRKGVKNVLERSQSIGRG
jgi:nitronate monooxygenase